MSLTNTYPNKQVVQLISSQIDADRMDYLLRDSYFTGASYGQFDLTRFSVLFVQLKMDCLSTEWDARIEDYVLSRYQMYMQVYFHPATRAMEVLLQNPLKRAKELYPDTKISLLVLHPHLRHFLRKTLACLTIALTTGL